MDESGLGQCLGAEFKNCWYTGGGWSIQSHFYDLKSRSAESDQRTIL